jgi:lysozyme
MESIKDMLVRHEGLRLKVYKDTVGKETIGVGRNLVDRGITKDEAMYLLDNDIKDFSQQLSEKLDWFTFKPEPVRNVLIDMAFNMGIVGLFTFTTTLAYIKAGDYLKASESMLQSKWAKQVGIRAINLSSILKSVI